MLQDTKVIYKGILRTVLMSILGSSLFNAWGAATISGTTNIRFPNIYVNEGGDYNVSSGVFTCRIPGQYWFSVTLTKPFLDSVDSIYCYMLVNGNWIILLYTNPYNDDLAHYEITASAGFHLKVGDRFQIGSCVDPEHIRNHIDTHISGFLIKADV